jgi:hypothetical protein
VRGGEFAQHGVAQHPRQSGITIDQLFGGAALVTHHDGVIHCLRRVAALARDVDAKAVTAEAELGNVPAAIGKQLADPHRARDDLVPDVRAAILGVNLVIACKAEPCADPLQCHQRVEPTRLGNDGIATYADAAAIPITRVLNLPVHDRAPSPVRSEGA